jgi:ubiquinone/menaquinone biosynthesis C-methylase UbiE
MTRNPKGISLDNVAGSYDHMAFTEKSRFRRRQVEMAKLREGETVLEVGCGTASLTVLARAAVGRGGRTEGVDIAPRMITAARAKAARLNLDIGFRVASVDELPYRDGTFDVVLSSLMFHHLPVPIKKAGLREIYRVLKTDGRLLLSDFCSPHWLTVPLMGLLLVWMPGTRHQLFGQLPSLIRESGFRGVKLVKKGLMVSHYLVTKS